MISVERIASRIYLIRSQKVMLDADLAALYGVETKVFNQAVRRNIDRFPEDFMFQLSAEEAAALRSQFVTLEKGRGRYPKYAPLAFSEQGRRDAFFGAQKQTGDSGQCRHHAYIRPVAGGPCYE